MASSQSIRRGQAPSVCHLCETDTNIQYKCLDCLLLMCQKCRDKIHVKIKNSERHKIVDIRDIGNVKILSEIDFENMKCADHSAFCCLFCNSCDQLVCLTCVTKGHKPHDLIEISEAYQQKLDEVEGIEESSEERLRHLRSILRNLEQFKSLQIDKMATEEKKLKDHKQALQRAVEHIDKLICDLKSSEEEVLTAVNNDIETIKQEEKITQAKHEGLTELKSSNDSSKFFNDIFKMEKTKEKDIPQTPSILMSIPRFVPKDIDITDIGELQRDSNTSNHVNLQIIKQYQSELADIGYTCFCADGCLWIGDGIDDTVQRVRPDKNKLKVLSTINTSINGMASTESGDLLISTGETRLQQISCKSGQISDTPYDMAPLVATAIHITQKGKVIVGVYDNDLDRRAVFVMDTDGRHERTYEHDNQGEPLLIYPLCITSTKNDNIHVADRDPDHDRGRLVVLSQGGDVINIYNGHPDENGDIPFCPIDIARTHSDNVVVLDLECLHLMDNTGHLLTVYDTNDAGIENPDSLVFTLSGSLWIGCSKAEKSTEEDTKLYHVTYTSKSDE